MGIKYRDPHVSRKFLKTVTEIEIIDSFKEHIKNGNSPISFSGNLNIGLLSLSKLRRRFKKFNIIYEEERKKIKRYNIYGDVYYQGVGLKNGNE